MLNTKKHIVKEFKHPFVRCSNCKVKLHDKNIKKMLDEKRFKNCCFLELMIQYGSEVAIEKAVPKLGIHTLSSLFKTVYGGTFIQVFASSMAPPGQAYFIQNVGKDNKKDET